MVLTPSSTPPGILGWFPATITTAMVSPMLRPTPRITEDRIPEEAAGTITLNTAFSFVSPSARAPSNKLLSKALSELSETVIIVGRIIKDRRTDAVMMLFPLPNMDLKSGTRTINPKKP